MRLPQQPPLEAFSGEERTAYEHVVARFAARNEPIGPYYASLLVSPIVCKQLSDGGVVFRQSEFRAGVPHKWREFTDIALGLNYDWWTAPLNHLADALAHGVRLEAIVALRRGREEDLLPDERQLLEYIHQVVNDRVTDDSYAALVARFGERGALDYTCFISWLMMTRMIRRAIGFGDATGEDFDARLQEYIDGKLSIPAVEETITS